MNTAADWFLEPLCTNPLRFSDHNKSVAKEKTCRVFFRCENTCSVASHFCTVAHILIWWKMSWNYTNTTQTKHSSHATKLEGLSCLTPPPPRTPSTWKMEKGGGGITCKREQKVPRVQSKKSVNLWFTSRLTHSSAAVTFSLTEEQRIW